MPPHVTPDWFGTPGSKPHSWSYTGRLLKYLDVAEKMKYHTLERLVLDGCPVLHGELRGGDEKRCALI